MAPFDGKRKAQCLEWQEVQDIRLVISSDLECRRGGSVPLEHVKRIVQPESGDMAASVVE